MSSSSSSVSGVVGVVRLDYDEKRTPLCSLSLLHHVTQQKGATNITVNPCSGLALNQSPALTFSNGETLYGSHLLLRYLARLLPSSTPSSSLDCHPHHLQGHNAEDATRIDYFIDLSRSLSHKDALSTHTSSLNSHLALRSFLVGYSLSLADLSVYEALLSNPRWPVFEKDSSSVSSFPHFFRWVHSLSSLSFLSTGKEIYRKNLESKEKKMYEQSFSGSFDVDLPGAEKGKVVTRFPPEPSGYLHIGHAKALLINEIIARKYSGKLIIRFDDTNPMKEKEEYEQAIKDDIKSLDIQWDRLTYTSDYFDAIEKIALDMLQRGVAYLDDTPQEQMQKERMDRVLSNRRNRSVEENVEIFKEMLAGTEEGRKNCMRAKIDMQSDNGTLRDPVLYRSNLTPHHRTGDKYKAYPTYDFACPIVDSVEGVTHAMRTSEYRDRDEQYYRILDLTGLKHRPIIREYARLNFQFTVMSKRKLQWFVDQKLVDGWYDPRFPTIQGVVRRGMTVPALRKFIEAQGFSVANTYQEWDKIWALNRAVLDPVAPRFMAVVKEGKVPFQLTNVANEESVTVNIHPKNKDVGSKVLTRSPQIYVEAEDAKDIAAGEELTLVAWGNAIVEKIERNSSGAITKLIGKSHPSGDPKKTSKKLTWISGAESDAVALTLVEYDHIITVAKIDEDTKIEEVVNRKSKVESAALGECAMRNLKKGQIIELMRKGFYRVDCPWLGANKPMVLFQVPDGKIKGIAAVVAAAEKEKEKEKAGKEKGKDKEKDKGKNKDQNKEKEKPAKKEEKDKTKAK